MQWLNVTSKTFGVDNVTVVLEWNDNQFGYYFVLITPPISGLLSTFSSNESSYHVTIPYNSQHTITVAASNCVGSNSTINKTLKFGEYTLCQVHYSNVVCLFLMYMHSQFSVNHH